MLNLVAKEIILVCAFVPFSEKKNYVMLQLNKPKVNEWLIGSLVKLHIFQIKISLTYDLNIYFCNKLHSITVFKCRYSSISFYKDC